ncbi:MAG: glycosyltransferase family 4 protein [Candidatus Hydrogenedentes bacterium]|nr:glycosyltransferase family 4 protein [Candidatus Hydrogenedentota bacterium]
MRIAFVDLLFSWPPHGGGCADVYYTVLGLQRLGHEVHLFYASSADRWERGHVESGSLPFPSTRLDFTARSFTALHVQERFRSAVSAWTPDVVFLAEAFFLRPHLVEALERYPIFSRYYAYDASCPRDFRRYLNDARCPLDYLKTPNQCRRCALNGQKREIMNWQWSAWTEEFLTARAFLPGYYDRLIRSLAKSHTLIVYNEVQAELWRPYNSQIHIVPGGVDISEFTHLPLQPKESNARKTILMAGRAEDPVKGLSTLQRATARLAQTRSDFEVWVTVPDHRLNTEHLKAVGWQDHAHMMRLYEGVDICVVPSLWEEPFGIVAVEAMAVGRPVVASRVGGLQMIVREGETGLLFEPDDDEMLAQHLSTLLDDFDLGRRMGDAGRKRAETEYDWQRIIERHYPVILGGVGK